MRLIRNVMLSILLASSGLAAVEGGKSPLCDVDWIGAASLGQIAEELDAGFTCPPGKNPLLVALGSEAGIDKIRLLVANVNVSAAWEELSPLHVAAGYSSLEIVKFLADRGYDINARFLEWSSASPLHAAAKYNPDAKVIDFLVENGAEINARDDFGRVPLHYAAESNPRLDVLQALLAHGADPMAKNTSGISQGMVPFHQALFTNPNIEIVKALYKPEFLDERIGGLTPLMLFAVSGRAEPVKFLIDKGAEVDAKDESGSTALIYAIIGSASSDPDLGGEHLSIVKKLLDNGADVSIKDDEFVTAIQSAFFGIDSHQPDMAVVTILLDYGADPADINDIPCTAIISGWKYKLPENLNAVLEKRGLSKIELNNTDDLSCYKKRALASVRSVSNFF